MSHKIRETTPIIHKLRHKTPRTLLQTWLSLTKFWWTTRSNFNRIFQKTRKTFIYVLLSFRNNAFKFFVWISLCVSCLLCESPNIVLCIWMTHVRLDDHERISCVTNYKRHSLLKKTDNIHTSSWDFLPFEAIHWRVSISL